MAYKSMTIAQAMERINENAFYLPAIQRKFVWDPERIERLFDSLMRDYPIGTFLFWKIKEERRNDYKFYQFIKDFHARDSLRNIPAASPRVGDRDILGVLDGQQRLTSMYVALQGSYTSKKKYARAAKDEAYQRMQLYVNVLHSPETPDEDAENDQTGASLFQFRFLSEKDAGAVAPGQYWYRVRDLLQYRNPGAMIASLEDVKRKYPTIAADLAVQGSTLLISLWSKLMQTEIISYFEVSADSLDDIVDIFVRVNSAGMQLSRTDLMFSTIVASWEEGRESIDDLIARLNQKGTGFAFDTDFVMRSCLVLLDLPVLFKVASFRTENVTRIRENWDAIAEALAAAVDVIASLGFSGETLTAKTVIIPLAYHLYHGGDAEASLEAMRQFVLRSLLKKVFSSKTDQALTLIREQFRDSLRVTRALPVADVLALRLPEGRTLRVSEDDLSEMLDSAKGREAFIILAAVYSHLRFDQVQFHQDHLHPYSQFTKAKLAKLGVSEDRIAQWQADRDKLPNLQLLEGSENQSKSATPLAEWVGRMAPGAAERFLASNHIPVDVSLALKDFDTFFAARRERLRQQLAQMFEVVP